MRIISLFLLLAACSPASVSGEVGGEPVRSPVDAVFDRYTFDLGVLGEVDVFAVVVTDVPDFCETWDGFVDNIEPDCAEQCEDWTRLGNDTLGRDAYYNLTFFAVFDPARTEGDFRLGGTIPAENEFTSRYTTYDTSQLYDQAGCVEWCEAGNPVVSNQESSPGTGTFTIDAYDEGSKLSGSFTLGFGADEISGDYRAKPCDAISSWFGLGE